MTVATEKAAIEKVLDRLRDAQGTGETPANSNHNFITDWYNANVAKIGNGPWCEMTVTWSCWTGGAKALKKGRAYTVWATQDAIEKLNGSSWHYGTKGMRAGDHVYFDWTGKKNDNRLVDHVGTVEKINANGTFYTLEGNTNNNKLERRLRDGKYVVGYVRLDWARIIPVVTPTPSKPKPTKPVPDTAKTKKIQTLLEVKADGQWGATTDNFAQLVRRAARNHVGYPKRVILNFNIKAVQRIIDTKDDGVFGSKSHLALVRWVKELQSVLGVTADGQWGPRTDNAYLAVRKRNLHNY